MTAFFTMANCANRKPICQKTQTHFSFLGETEWIVVSVFFCFIPVVHNIVRSYSISCSSNLLQFKISNGNIEVMKECVRFHSNISRSKCCIYLIGKQFVWINRFVFFFFDRISFSNWFICFRSIIIFCDWEAFTVYRIIAIRSVWWSQSFFKQKQNSNQINGERIKKWDKLSRKQFLYECDCSENSVGWIGDFYLYVWHHICVSNDCEIKNFVCVLGSGSFRGYYRLLHTKLWFDEQVKTIIFAPFGAHYCYVLHRLHWYAQSIQRPIIVRS